MGITYQDKKPQEEIKRVIVLVSNGKHTAVNPEWQLASCPKCVNCGGRRCVLCSRLGVYRE